MEEPRKKVGEKIKEKREALGLSTVALAAAAGVSERAIYLLEKGVTRAPARATVQKLAAALGLEEGELAGDLPAQH